MVIKIISLVCLFIVLVNGQVKCPSGTTLTGPLSCHSGNLVFSTAYCQNSQNQTYIAVGNTTASPCFAGHITVSTGYQQLPIEDNTFELYNCNLTSGSGVYYQVGGCGTAGVSNNKTSALKFGSNKYYYFLNCIQGTFGQNSYSSWLATSPQNIDGASICKEMNAVAYALVSWVYGTDECPIGYNGNPNLLCYQSQTTTSTVTTTGTSTYTTTSSEKTGDWKKPVIGLTVVLAVVACGVAAYLIYKKRKSSSHGHIDMRTPLI